MKLSVVIPAHNEEGSIEATARGVVAALEEAEIEHEIVIVDDGSSDGTAAAIDRLAAARPRVRALANPNPGGFGLAVRAGLEEYTGDAVAIVMADGSDDPADLVTYHHLLESGYECAFGSRFIEGAEVEDYPLAKLVMNRIVNRGILLLFGHRYNDTTNAFKAYRREVIESVSPLLSHHFNLTVELPLKAIIRGHSYAITPIRWRNRTAGRSKFAFQEMGSRYLFITLYAFLEHHLSRGDYRRSGVEGRGRWRAGLPALVASAERAPARASAATRGEGQGPR